MPHTAEGFPPQVGDRFTLLRELGRGGMATVFLAEDRKHNRQVAIKILHRELMEVLGPARFQREVAIAARLNHPHILTLIESGESGGVLWYAMPFVEGESLRARMERVGQFTVADVLSIARQIAAALDYAHEQGVVHRDIKPENVMLAGDHAWVADFGIARLTQMDEGSPITSASLVVGTPQYMSPEQARGGTAALDGRVDVYALGCVVYEMLAGAPPFTAPSRETLLARHALDPVPPLRTVRGGVTVAAQEVIEKALAKSAADRHATAGAFVTALERAFASRRRWSRRQIVTAAGMAAGVVAAAWLLWPRSPLEARRVVVMPLEVRASPGLAGDEVSYVIEAGLNRTDTLLARYDAGGLDAPPARWADSTLKRIGEAQSARYVLTGRVVTTDSVRAELQLHDLVGGTPDYFSVAAGAGIDAAMLGSRVVREALLRLLPTGGRSEDPSVISSDPGAMALFVKGEREYRRGNFVAADSLYGEALARDTGFAWAALRAAQTASWLTKRSEAQRLARKALERADSLPRRYATLARGLEAYMAGEPVQALAHFREALDLDPRWAEAWMAWGEVWFHLLPAAGSPLDSASLAFMTARRIDPAFTTPLWHQLQLAAWGDDRGRVDSLARLLDRTGLPPDDQAIADLMQACVRRSPAVEDWRKAVARSPAEALSAAHWVSVGGARLWPCALEGFGAVFRADTGRSVNAFYSQVGLVSLLAARDDAAGAMAALAEDLFPPNRDQLLVFLASAGLSFGPAADSAARRLDIRLGGTGLFTAPTAWAAGVGALLRGDTLLARPLTVLDSIATRGDSSRQREARLYHRSLEARRMLFRGDTTTTMTTLSRLVPNGNQDVLRWRPWEALGWERLQLAELLAARRDWRRAMDVAAGFDSPAAIGLVPWVPASLLLRERVALELGETARAAGFRARYQSLRGRAGSIIPPGR